MRRNPTAPIGDIDPRDPGLLTKSEFLQLRNRQGKLHPSDAYRVSVEDLNRPTETLVGRTTTDDSRRRPILVYAERHDLVDNRLVFRDDESGDVVAVLRDGVLYRDRFWKVPSWYQSGLRAKTVTVDLPIREEKQVKYPVEFAANIAETNRETYPLVLQRVKLGRDLFELRAESEIRPDKLDTIVLLNESGQIVARGDNEWGATLIRVAKEYQGRGLGRFMTSVWYQYNPGSVSGGFTEAGARNALATREDRVHEYLAQGWYSELVRSGRMTHERVKSILADLPKRPHTPLRRLPTVEPLDEAQLLAYVDDDGTSFVLYDRRFFEDQDPKYVHGYGFLRDSSAHGTFFYRIEHDAAYRELVSAIGLQLARDYGEPIYVASAPGDVIEWESVPGAEHRDGYVALTRDILPLREMAQRERRERQPYDPYRQIRDTLLEMAESKWS